MSKKEPDQIESPNIKNPYKFSEYFICEHYKSSMWRIQPQNAIIQSPLLFDEKGNEKTLVL